MKIGLLIPSLAGGGAERVVSIISKEMSNNNEVYIINYENVKPVYDYGGQIIELDVPSKKSFISKITNLIKRVSVLKKICNNYNFDVIISFLESANKINVLTSKKGKSIISIRNYNKRMKKDIYYYINCLFSRLLYKKADEIVAVSALIKETIINEYNLNRKKVHVIYNPIDCNKIAAMQKESIPLSDEYIFEKKCIVSVGRLEYQKGHVYMLNILKKILEKMDVNLVIIGVGTLKKSLIQEIDRLNIKDNVFLLGFQENPYRYMDKADMFILTSLFEGFPNVLLEAVACGKVIVSTNCSSGPNEILCESFDLNHKVVKPQKCEYGTLLPDIYDISKNNNNSLDNSLDKFYREASECICEILSDDKIRKSFQERTLARANDFNLEAINKKWNQLLTKI